MMRVLLLSLLCFAAPVGAEPVIALSGEAEFGVTYSDGDGSGNHGRFTLDTDARVRTDNGLSIGAQVRLRSDPGRPADMSAARFYISTGDPRRLPRR
jgi:hypothetical protein